MMVSPDTLKPGDTIKFQASLYHTRFWRIQGRTEAGFKADTVLTRFGVVLPASLFKDVPVSLTSEEVELVPENELPDVFR